MLISLYTCFSIIFVTCYSALKYFKKQQLISLSNGEIAILKLASILLLLERNATHWIYNATLLFYAAGDFVIIWNQPLSLIFFQIGHLFFLSTYHQCNIYYEIFLPVLAILTFIIHYFLIYNNPKLNGKYYEHVLYWSYIYTLHCFLLVPIFNGYFGTIPFVLSDLSIGLSLDIVHVFEYPLYYVSLLYLRYTHVTF